MEQQSNGMAIAALVCGILGIVGSFIPVVCYFTLILAILGIIFGAKSRKNCPTEKKGLATAGMVLGIIGTAFSAVGVICVLACAATAGTAGLLS